MISKLLIVLGQLFKDSTYGDTLQQYIESRNPKTTADVELFTRQFSRNYNVRGGALW